MALQNEIAWQMFKFFLKSHKRSCKTNLKSKINNKGTSATCKFPSKLTIKIAEWRGLCTFSDNFEQMLCMFLVYLFFKF